MVTLPLFPRMADADVDRVCEAVGKVLAPAQMRKMGSVPN
jgi:dTDP-4-amino-4,6-dideoxygalactose transaminase